MKNQDKNIDWEAAVVTPEKRASSGGVPSSIGGDFVRQPLSQLQLGEGARSQDEIVAVESQDSQQQSQDLLRETETQGVGERASHQVK